MNGTRISSLLGKITVIVVICCCSLPAQAKYGGGSGTPEDPYQIWDANHMQAIGADANDWDKHFMLMADIDLSQFDGKEGRPEFNIIGYYIPVPIEERPFTGVFDGNGHTISNFTYEMVDYGGLFGLVNGPNAEIKNLGLVDPNIHGHYGGCLVVQMGEGTISSCYVEDGYYFGWGHVGLLVGVSSGTVNNCYATGYVSGFHSGGLIGVNQGNVSGCFFNGTVDGVGEHLGGLIGHQSNATVTNCYSSGSVTGNDKVGGLVGTNFSSGDVVISNCYSSCRVSGDIYVGGLIGFNNMATPDIINSFWDIETSGQTGSAGGEGKTTAEMMQQSTFEGWDFVNVWEIGENQTYPYLRKYSAANINKDHKVDLLDIRILCEQWLEEK